MNLQSVRSLLGELGILNGVLYGINRFVSRWTHDRVRLIKYYLVAQPLSAQDLLPPHRGREIEIRFITPHDPEIKDLPRPAPIIESRYAQGGQCLAAFRRGSLIGFLWFNLGPYDEDEVRCRFDPIPSEETAWDYDVYVDPKHRLSPVFAKLWSEATFYLRKSKRAWSLSRISAFNSGSLAAHSRLGARRLGTANFILIGRWQIMISTLSPYFHISSTPTAVPLMRPKVPPR